MKLDEALRKIHAIHDFISESPEYSYLRFLGDWDRGSAELRMRNLFGRCRLYALTQSIEPDLRETQRLIEGTLSNVE